MTCVSILAFLSANKVNILAAWVVLEQYLAANKNIRANSSLQLILNMVNAFVSANKSQTGR
jgi:hypothetical protein